MKKLQAGLVLLVGFYSYSSFSNDLVHGTTSNATSDAYNWVMTNVLPQQAGLEVTGIFYKYTAVKDPETDMVVWVQNEDAVNDGQYIFREVDDWSGRPGKTIKKYIPQNDVLINRWGDGSIEWEGEGTVEDPMVTYDYRYDPCFDPQSSPECPGYIPEIPEIPEVDLSLIDSMNQDLIDKNEKDKEVDPELLDDDEEERERKMVQQRKKERLEVALGAVNSALMTAEAQAKYASLMSLSLIPQTYVETTIPGGTYEEPVVLKDKNLPDNKSARRVGLAQQLLHEKMVNSQYESKSKTGEQE